MSGPTGNWHTGRERHLRVCREDAWGHCPAEPEWHALPLVTPGFGLKAENPRFRPATLYGGWRRSVQLPRGQVVAGRLGTMLWPELADLLLGMALERADGTPHSFTMDFRTPSDPRRYLGAMVERLELRGRAGERDVSVHLDLTGKAEETNPSLSSDAFDYSGLSPMPFTFEAAEVLLDVGRLTGVESFALSVRNNLSAGPQGPGGITYLRAGHRDVSLELTKLDDSDAVNAAIRSGGTLSFEMTLSHPEGHSLSLALPVVHAQAAPEKADPGDLAHATLRMEAGTDGADDITWNVSLSE